MTYDLPLTNVMPSVRICEGGMAYHDLSPTYVLLCILMLLRASSNVREKACHWCVSENVGMSAHKDAKSYCPQANRDTWKETKAVS